MVILSPAVPSARCVVYENSIFAKFKDAAVTMPAGFKDAYRQFIEPVVGAGGERIATPIAGPPDSRLS